MAQEGKNLYQKISAITDSLGLVQKDATAPKEMGGFRFLSHGMMLGHLRGELTKFGVVIVPSGEEILRVDTYQTGSGKAGRIVTLKYKFTVVDIDDPTVWFEAYWIGEGQDTADKAVQKAGTSAEKYFLMKLFKVGDKDDPDAAKGDDMTTKTQSVSANLPKADEKPVDVPVESIPSNGKVNENPPKGWSEAAAQGQRTLDGNEVELKAKQLKALIWFGEQLPPSEGWFPGKINALVQLWDNKKKSGKITPEEEQAGSAVKHVFGMIAETHHKICGEDCQHIVAAEMAVVLGGTIKDPA